jgi:hypothetical protein
MTGAPVKTKIAALLVVIALGGLAAFTLFSGPTRVPAGGGSHAAPTQVIPSGGEPEEGGGGD